MTIGSGLSLLLFAGVIPAISALVVALLLGRVLAKSEASRWAAAAAMGVAFCVGLLISTDRPPWIPNRHWHWLPYLALVAMLFGPVSVATGVRLLERLLLFLLLAILAGILLTPTWASLEPSRAVLIPVFSVYVFLLSALLGPLANRIDERLFSVMLTLVALAAAIMLTAEGSFTYGRVTLVAAGAAAGVSLATFIRHRRGETTLRGAVCVFVILVGGSAYVGHLDPPSPLTDLMLVPLAPLALWAGAAGPLARLRGAKAGMLQTALVLAPLIIAFILVNW